VADFNTASPHSWLGYQTPAAYAEVLTGSSAVQDDGSTPPPVAYPAPNGVILAALLSGTLCPLNQTLNRG
jgi:hypothetical protein